MATRFCSFYVNLIGKCGFIVICQQTKNTSAPKKHFYSTSIFIFWPPNAFTPLPPKLKDDMIRIKTMQNIGRKKDFRVFLETTILDLKRLKKFRQNIALQITFIQTQKLAELYLSTHKEKKLQKYQSFIHMNIQYGAYVFLVPFSHICSQVCIFYVCMFLICKKVYCVPSD